MKEITADEFNALKDQAGWYAIGTFPSMNRGCVGRHVERGFKNSLTGEIIEQVCNFGWLTTYRFWTALEVMKEDAHIPQNVYYEF